MTQKKDAKDPVLYTAPVFEGIHYTDEGQGTTILFLHGTLTNSMTWRKMIPFLSSEYRCIAVNLPLGGHAIPLSSIKDYSPIGLARLIDKLLTFLGIGKIVVVANDTGGVYAQVYTALFPDKVSGLILSNCEGLDVFPPLKFAYLKYAVWIPGFTYCMGKLFAVKSLPDKDFFMGLLSHTLTSEEWIQYYLCHFSENSRIRSDFASAVKTWSPRYTMLAADRLKLFHKPVLIVWGADDKTLFPAKLGIRICGVFLQSRLVMVKNARTFVQEDQPEVFSREIKKFLIENGK